MSMSIVPETGRDWQWAGKSYIFNSLWQTHLSPMWRQGSSRFHGT
jgi:hypothetical protein